MGLNLNLSFVTCLTLISLTYIMNMMIHIMPYDMIVRLE